MMDTPPIQDNYAFIISTNRVKSEGAYFYVYCLFRIFSTAFSSSIVCHLLCVICCLSSVKRLMVKTSGWYDAGMYSADPDEVIVYQLYSDGGSSSDNSSSTNDWSDNWDNSDSGSSDDGGGSWGDWFYHLEDDYPKELLEIDTSIVDMENAQRL